MDNSQEKREISIKEILADLDNGLSRDDIKERYNLKPFELKALFNHPQLKGKRTKKSQELSFVIVDDTQENQEEPNTAEPKDEIAEQFEESQGIFNN